jgi:hypothetical protein
MVESLYRQYKLHTNLESSAIAKIGASFSEKATWQDFLPFPDTEQGQKQKIPMSRETAQIYIELRDIDILPPRVLGAFADIEGEIEKLVK